MNPSRAAISSGESAPTPFRWRGTLFFRLALVVNLAVIGVLGSFAAYDYRRHETTHIDNEFERLREEAKVLRVGRLHLPDDAQFQKFVDEVCRQMGSAASPGHHIVVFDKTGDVLVRAHERANPDLEAKMAVGKVGRPVRFLHNGGRYLSVIVQSSEAETIAVAQSLAPIEELLAAQRASTLASTGILVVLIFGITTVGFLVWVRDPLRNLVRGVAAVGRSDFSSRVRPSGTAELRFLAQQINEMTQSLQSVEHERREEMERARRIQRSLLPDGRLVMKYAETAGLFQPATSVGGDLYDVIELQDGSVLLAMLDVAGHDVPAALYMALLRTVLRYHATGAANLSDIAGAMNQELCNLAGSGDFASCFLARLTPHSSEVHYVNAGHPPAVVVRADGVTELLDGRDLLLGIDSGVSYVLRTAALNTRDRLFLFTDGLYEVFGLDERLLGRDRLVSLLAETSPLPLERQLEEVLRRICAFQGGTEFEDDVTLLGLRRN